MLTIRDILVATAQRYPERTALVLDNQRLSYRELDELSNRVAHVLLDSGLKKGDHVALLMSYCPEWLVNYFGIVKAGGKTVILNSMLKPHDYDTLLRDSDSSVLLTESSFAGALEEVIPAMGGLRRVYERDTAPLAQLLHDAPATLPDVEVDAGDETAIIYTSGVLGKQKGVVHTHSSLMEAATIIAPGLEQTADDITVGMIPFFYLLGLAVVALISVLKGSTMVLVPRFTPHRLLEVVQQEKATILVGVPAMFNALAMVDEATLQDCDLTSLRVAVTAGAKASRNLMAELERKYGLTLCEVYGTTEAVGSVFGDIHNRKLGTAGKPIQEVRLLDDDGNEVPVGEVGEFMCSSPQMMKGYYNAPELTARVLHDGWFHSGDLFRMDDEGYMEYIEKKSFIIVTSAGTKIPPTEVENVLLTHPAVAEVALVGIKDGRGNQIPTLFVVPRENTHTTPVDIRRFCSENLASYKMPQDIRFLESLPKTGSGKMDRRSLMDMYGVRVRQ